jgi:hypothetical protein
MQHIIHFWGRLNGQENLEKVFAAGRAFAEARTARVARFDIHETELIRIQNRELTTYQGRVRGIMFSLEGQPDPIILEFDEDLFMQQFCKTTSPGTQPHDQITYLLKEIEPFFEKLIVVNRPCPVSPGLSPRQMA